MVLHRDLAKIDVKVASSSMLLGHPRSSGAPNATRYVVRSFAHLNFIFKKDVAF